MPLYLVGYDAGIMPQGRMQPLPGVMEPRPRWTPVEATGRNVRVDGIKVEVRRSSESLDRLYMMPLGLFHLIVLGDGVDVVPGSGCFSCLVL